MKLEITFKSGAQVSVDVSEFKSHRSQIEGGITQLDWTTPQDWTRKLHSLDLSEIACLVAVEEPMTYDENPSDQKAPCTYPSRNNGDGRGCEMDDCPRHGGEDR